MGLKNLENRLKQIEERVNKKTNKLTFAPVKLVSRTEWEQVVKESRPRMLEIIKENYRNWLSKRPKSDIALGNYWFNKELSHFENGY